MKGITKVLITIFVASFGYGSYQASQQMQPAQEATIITQQEAVRAVQEVTQAVAPKIETTPVAKPTEAPKPIETVKPVENKPTKQYYNTEGVYITIDGIKYTLKGTALYKGNEFLTDFKSVIYKDASLQYDNAMTSTLLITDLSYDKWNGHTIIFAVGVAFKVNKVDFNDTSSYKDGLVKVGTPYTVLFSYNLDKDISIYPYNSGTHTYMQLYACMEDLYSAPYKIDNNDDRTTWNETFLTNFNYASQVVHPRIIKAKNKEHAIYLLLEEKDYGVVRGIRHVKLYEVNTSRTPEAYTSKPYEKIYVELSFFDDIAKGIDDNYAFNNYGMYVTEISKDKFVFVNEGKNLHVAAEFNLPDRGSPTLIQQYWKRP